MTSHPRLVRSVPFWILLVGSLALTVIGGWLSFTKLITMVAGLNAQTATTADVYGGQSWIVVGGAILAAGLIGLVATLSLAVVRSLLAAPEPAADEPDDEVAIASDDLPFVEAAPSADVATSLPADPAAAAAVAPPSDAADEPVATAEGDLTATDDAASAAGERA